jgi:hypothetical protein
MPKFAALVMALWSLFTLCVALPRAASQPTSAAQRLFAANDGQPCAQPCLLGIPAAEGDMERALSALAEHPSLDGARWYRHNDALASYNSDAGSGDLRVSAGRATIHLFPARWLPLADVLAALGAPERVLPNLWSNPPHLVLIFQGGQIAAQVVVGMRSGEIPERLWMRAPVARLEMTDGLFYADRVPGRWRGFVRLRVR